ncbi:putative dehydrogenase [Labrenzia sp. EL_208]|nr:putative dehydrogenase [Labrenzia sp. EL_132]MBG6232576.1 putative dehydrogenase [Labrenzia sp. EL_208]
MNIQNKSFCIAVAGFGWWGRHIVNRLKLTDGIAVPVVIEPNETVHDQIRDAGPAPYTRFEDVLKRPDIDAVVLTTPNPLHEEQVRQCAAAGKHVFCEKPLGLTGESARRSVKACKEAGVTLGIGHERRFEPAMEALKAEIERGGLGKIMHAEAAFSHDKLIGVPSGDWRTSKSTCPAAGMTAMGIHLTDLLISFFGPVKTVQAMTADRSLGWETGDLVTVQLGFREGMTATLSAILHTPHFIRMHVFGTEKWVEARNDTHPDTPGGKVSYVESVTGMPLKETAFEWTDTVIHNLEAFRDACLRRRPYRVSHQEMIHNIEVLEAIAQSAEHRETIHLNS